MLAPVLALALVCTLSLPASAFFWNKKTDVPSVSDFSKNGMVGQVISFSAEDFPVSGGSGGSALAAITLKTLPDIGAGMLTVGGQPLTEGALVDASRPERAPVPSSAHPLCQRDCLHLPSLLYHRRDR